MQQRFKKRVNDLLRGIGDIADFISSQEHVKPLPSYNVSWLCLTRNEHEAAEVYMLGRLLWTIFEGVSAPNRSDVWQSYKWEPDLEFPAFRRTPRGLRDLIDRCTRGRRLKLSEKVARVGNKLALVPDSETLDDERGLGSGDGAEEMAIHLAAKKWWTAEVGHAEAFLDEREKLLAQGLWTGNPFNRPSLRTVLDELDEFRKEMGVPEFKH